MSNFEDIFDSLDEPNPSPTPMPAGPKDDMMEVEHYGNQEWEQREESLFPAHQPEFEDVPMTQLPLQSQRDSIDEIENSGDDEMAALDQLAKDALEQTADYASPDEGNGYPSGEVSMDVFSPYRTRSTSPPLDLDSPTFDGPQTRARFPRRRQEMEQREDEEGDDLLSLASPKRRSLVGSSGVVVGAKPGASPSPLGSPDDTRRFVAEYFTPHGLEFVEQFMKREKPLQEPFPYLRQLLRACHYLERDALVSNPDGSTLVYDTEEDRYMLVRNRNVALMAFAAGLAVRGEDDPLILSSQRIDVMVAGKRRSLRVVPITYETFDPLLATHEATTHLLDALIERLTARVDTRRSTPGPEDVQVKVVGLLQNDTFGDLLARWLWGWISASTQVSLDPLMDSVYRQRMKVAEVYATLDLDSSGDGRPMVLRIGQHTYLGDAQSVVRIRHILAASVEPTFLQNLSSSLRVHWIRCTRESSVGSDRAWFQSFADHISALLFAQKINERDLRVPTPEKYAPRLTVAKEAPGYLLAKYFPESKADQPTQYGLY